MHPHPQRIGPYQVVRMLGAGGYGTVFEARHPRFPRSLALKLINTRTASERAIGRFWREAELLARIQHPGVVAIHQLGRSPEGPYLVEDLIEGTPLDRVLEEGPLLPERAATIARDLAAALEAVHAEQILHRDLKPGNVVLTPAGKPVLLDFGLARDANAEQLTRTGDMIGTPAYMSPEQARAVSPGELGPQVDVYGLGAILFHMLAGRPPHEADGLIQAIAAVIAQEPEWPTEAEAPAPLIRILKLALAKSPDERYATIAELRADLDAFLAGESGVGASRLAAVGAARRRRGAAKLLAGAALLGLLGLGGLGLARLTAPAPATGLAPSASAAPGPTPLPTPTGFAGLWNLAPGDELRFRTAFEEHETSARITLGVWYLARAAASEGDQVRLDVTIEAATCAFGSSMVGGGVFDGRYDSRAPSRSPLRAVGDGVGQRFTLILDPHTGHVVRLEGVDAIGARVAQRIRATEGRAIPNFEKTIRDAFNDAFIGRFMETLLHVRGEPLLPWEETKAHQGRRFAAAAPEHDRVLKTLSTVYAHTAGQVFRITAAAHYASGRLQRSQITQALIGQRTRRGALMLLPPSSGRELTTTWSFHLQRAGDAPLSDYGE